MIKQLYINKINFDEDDNGDRINQIDEISIGTWFHMEMMDREDATQKASYYINIGGVIIYVNLKRNNISVSVTTPQKTITHVDSLKPTKNNPNEV